MRFLLAVANARRFRWCADLTLAIRIAGRDLSGIPPTAPGGVCETFPGGPCSMRLLAFTPQACTGRKSMKLSTAVPHEQPMLFPQLKQR